MLIISKPQQTPQWTSDSQSSSASLQLNQTHCLEELKLAIAPLRKKLLSHPVYECLTSKAALQIFMEHHVFAVWDFMSLLKRLQQQLTCTQVPWTQPQNLDTARLINEIVIAEETDRASNGRCASHFQLYMDAMKQIGANQSSILEFQTLLKRQMPSEQAFSLSHVPKVAVEFMSKTLEVCTSCDPVVVAAYLLLGREDLIPDLFTQLIEGLRQTEPINIQGLLYYLERHIELDGAEHGPAGEQLIINLCGNSASAWQTAQESAIAALKARLKLWNGIEDEILLNQSRSI